MPEPMGCAECGASIPIVTRRPRKYCSRRCSDRAAQRAHRERVPRTRTPEVFTKTCEWCDKTYTTSRRPGRYCSNHCASYGNGQAALTSELTWRYCEPCDRMYPRGRCPQRDTHPTKTLPDLPPRPCHSCGTPVPADPAGYVALYCSDACRRRRAQTRRRIAQPSRHNDPVTDERRLAIYERDRWVCQLCKRKVNSKLKGSHPKAPSLDHVLPRSLGGTNDEANLQLAHFECNTRKGNRVNGHGEQLRLAV